MSATWTPGDRFQLAALGDQYDGTTGRVRGLWKDLTGREHAHVDHDDGTIASWPIARLERPSNPSGGAVTSTPSASPAASSQAGLAAVRYGFHPGAVEEGPVPALVQLDQSDAAARLEEAGTVLESAFQSMPSQIPAALQAFRTALADFRSVVAS